MLFFHSKSADKKPGCGVNETLGDADPTLFDSLASFRDWRKILSNFHVGRFEHRGREYNSVEHAFQAAKISLVDEEKGLSFSLNSGSALACADGLAARKQRKMVVLNPPDLRTWNAMKDEVLEDILRSKFVQVEEARRVLLATEHAQLWHGTRGAPSSRQISLEKVRDELREAMHATSTGSSSSRSSDVPSKRAKMNDSRHEEDHSLD